MATKIGQCAFTFVQCEVIWHSNTKTMTNSMHRSRKGSLVPIESVDIPWQVKQHSTSNKTMPQKLKGMTNSFLYRTDVPILYIFWNFWPQSYKGRVIQVESYIQWLKRHQRSTSEINSSRKISLFGPWTEKQVSASTCFNF